MEKLNLPLLVYVLFTLVALGAAITDVLYDRIFNWLTFPALILALVLSAWFLGLRGLGLSAMSTVIVLFLFFPLFFLNVLGAGDVKLLMVLGATLGPTDSIELLMDSLLFGGIGAIGLLVYHQRVEIFIKEVLKSFRSAVMPGLVFHPPKLSEKIKAPFGLPIFFAYLCALQERLM